MVGQKGNNPKNPFRAEAPEAPELVTTYSQAPLLLAPLPERVGQMYAFLTDHMMIQSIINSL